MAGGFADVLGWARDQLSSDYPVARYGMAAILAFGTLFALDAIGAPVAWPMAVVAFAGLLMFGGKKG